MLRRVALLVGLLCTSVAYATPTIAVLPLRDLAGGRSAIGAALRETLTVDLRATPGVRVVERDRIDRVIREQALDDMRLGTLLGATHLVTGAYQRQGSTLRVTMRLIAVETGQVVGSAKMDGELERMLELEDRVDAALLGSMGWKVPARARPRLPAKSIERFGEAQLETDVGKKTALLQDVVAQSPQFGYAVDQLAALEGRLATYEEASQAALTKQERADLAKGRDVLDGMRNQRRYHALRAACELSKPSEPVAYARFVAETGLRHVDAALAAGEAYCKTYASGPHFAEVDRELRELADEKRTMATRRADYDRDLAEKKDDWGPCIAARWNRQYNALMVDGCRAYAAKHDADEHSHDARLFVVLALGQMGRWDEMKKALADFRARYGSDEELDKKLAEWPSD